MIGQYVWMEEADLNSCLYIVYFVPVRMGCSGTLPNTSKPEGPTVLTHNKSSERQENNIFFPERLEKIESQGEKMTADVEQNILKD